MRNSDSRFVQLFNSYMEGSCSDEERKEFLKYAVSEKYKSKLLEIIEKMLNEQDPGSDKNLHNPDIIWDRILEEVKIRETEAVISTKNFSLNRIWWAAAAILLPAIILTFLYVKYENAGQIAGAQLYKSAQADILPGGNKAMLILSDHSEILLDTARTGIIGKQGTASISKLGDGKLAYHSESNPKSEILYNTVVTPRGGQYQLKLPDGTNVWLNAASSIKFPTNFAGKKRVVEVSGELFFEVTHNPQLPFIVKTSLAKIEVLGTSFNVNTYNEKMASAITLVEGSLKLSNNTNMESQVLKPGQQAFLNENGKIRLNDKVNVGSAIAWKNGYFQFNDTELETVMQQISRWYDFEVVYDGKQKNIHLTGIISRNVNASDVFKMLEISGVNVTLKDHVVVVN